MMWELISANKRRSIMLFVVMFVCLVALGYLVGEALYGENGGMGGLFIALGLWGFLSVVSVFGGGSIMLASSRARPVTRELYPQLYNIVEEMKISAGLPAIPKIYIIDDPAPNAFATGFTPEKSAIAVTTGLLARLNRDELQGVIAHETSHIMNRDVQFMTIAGVMLGSIVLISEVFLRGMWLSGGGRRRSRVDTKGGGQAQMIIILIAIAVAILAPIFARLFYFAISRQREYLADASGARLTRYPEGLASALEKIANTDKRLAVANKVTAPMYIVNPLAPPGRALTNLTSTHPPLQKRIEILRAMSSGVNYTDYQRAFSKVMGKPTMIIPGSGLKEDEKGKISIRQASDEDTTKPGGKKSTRDAIDLMRAVNGYAFIVCACGLKMKLPPDYKDPSIKCPRCGRNNEVPLAVLAGVGAMGDMLEKSGAGGIPEARPAKKPSGGGAKEGPLEYVRKGRGWETFACSCGALMQLSPAFSAKTMQCRTCGRVTRIVDTL
jgi:heat shock protein HtpX